MKDYTNLHQILNCRVYQVLIIIRRQAVEDIWSVRPPVGVKRQYFCYNLGKLTVELMVARPLGQGLR